jgi:outer membrane protein W
MKKILMAGAISMALCGSAFAQNEPNPLHFMVGVGLTVGGENVATAQYTDGSSNNISAGTGAQLMTGLDYRLNQSVSFEATVGYRVRVALGSNGNASFNRFPIDLLAYYNVDPNWRLGGGVEYINHPTLSASGAIAGLNEDFKNTTGLVLEAEYFPMPNLGVKFRAVKETYKPVNPYNTYTGKQQNNVDGSNFEVLSDYYF